MRVVTSTSRDLMQGHDLHVSLGNAPGEFLWCDSHDRDEESTAENQDMEVALVSLIGCQIWHRIRAERSNPVSVNRLVSSLAALHLQRLPVSHVAALHSPRVRFRLIWGKA